MNLRGMTTEELLSFTATLSTRDWRQLSDDDFERIEEFIHSDGCTGVPEFYHNGCVMHDWWYRTHRNLDGTAITKREADRGLEEYIEAHSPLGNVSIIARLWYWGVRRFGRKAWM